MIVEYIDDNRERFGVDPICRVLTEHGMAIAPSTYYARKKAGVVSETVLAEAYAADEAFVSGTLGGVTPVASIDGRALPTQGFGPVTARLSALYQDGISRAD